MSFRKLTWGEVVLVEDQLRPLIQQALDRDLVPLYTVDDILHDVYEEYRQVWIIEEGAIILGFVGTKIAIYPRAKAMVMDLAATKDGVQVNWDECIEGLRTFSEDNECHVAFLYGRRGWEKALKNVGFTVDGITLRIKI